MRILPEHEQLFSQPRANKWLKRPRGPRPNALMPLTMKANPEVNNENYLFSTDPRCLRLTESLRQRLNDVFPVDVLSSGFAGPTAVPGNFNALLSVSGCGMDPLPIPVMRNHGLITSYGLRVKPLPSDLPWLQEVIRLFFGAAVPANLHIRKAASTGFPFFTTDNGYKKTAALDALRNIDRYLNLAVGGTPELKELLTDFHAEYVYAVQERQQPDTVREEGGVLRPKDRIAPSEDEARSGKFDGKTVADKRVFDNAGNVIPDHFAMRRRDVFGFNGPMNYVMSAIMGCFKEVHINRFAFTYKTRGASDKRERISKYKYVVGSDVKTMDKMVPEWFSEFFFEELTKYLDERAVIMMRRAFRATYVVPPPWRETPTSYNPVYGRSPLIPEFDNHVGLPSGIAYNPIFGKLWMTFVYSLVFRDAGALTRPADLEAFLQGKNPDHALLDMADDAAMLTNSASVAAKLRTATSPYAVLEPEVPVIFLGDVFCEVDGRKEVYPNPLTYVVNALCREDSIIKPSNTVGLWADSYVARATVYSSTPVYRDISAIYEEECRKHLGVNPLVIAKTMAVNQRMTEVDAMVKLKPETIHYLIDPKDVSAAVLDDLVATIPASDFWPSIKHLFKVPTVDYQEI